MKWEEFLTEVASLLEKKVLEGEFVKIQRVPKNNGVVLSGVCIFKKGGKITPTIYLEKFYEKYQEGMELEEIVDAILEKHRSLQCDSETNLEFFTDYEMAKKRIVFRLVNLERNRERLREMPYIPYLDLAIVFYCHVTSEANCHAAIPIYTKHMQMWNVDKEELLKMAMKNTQKLFPCELFSMFGVLQDMIKDIEGDKLEDVDLESCSISMYILTNACKLNGAAVILYKNVLADFANACDGDFYLLPSSIHEVILVPATKNHSMEEFTKMVQEVNEIQVEAEEVLSDHAYYYSREQGKLLL